MRIWGVHIGEVSAVLARKAQEPNGIDHIEVIPLDTHLPREVALSELMASIHERGLFESDDHINLSFYEPESSCFISELDRSISDVDETLAWELDQRVEGCARSYAFSTDKINGHRYLCAGMPQKIVTNIVKRFSRLDVEVSSIDVPIVASLQALEANGMQGQSYMYVEAGVSSTTLVVVKDGSPKSLRTLAYRKGVEAAVLLLKDAREDFPETVSYLLAGEAIGTMETAHKVFAEVPGGNVSHPLHLITYSGTTAVDKYLPLLTPAVGLSLKAV